MHFFVKKQTNTEYFCIFATKRACEALESYLIKTDIYARED